MATALSNVGSVSSVNQSAISRRLSSSKSSVAGQSFSLRPLSSGKDSKPGDALMLFTCMLAGLEFAEMS
jgi:hypothetical protein